MLAKDLLEKTRTIETVQPIETSEQKKEKKEKRRFFFFKAKENEKDNKKEKGIEENKLEKERENHLEVKSIEEEQKTERKKEDEFKISELKRELKEDMDFDFEELISKNKGFFARLLENIYEKSFEELAKKDLIEEIKHYFESEKNREEIEYEKKAAYVRLKNLLLELSKLEEKWENQNIILEQYKEQIKTTEERIRELSEIIKREAQKLSLEENIPPEKEFVLNDGRRLKNLKELLEALKTMDENLFKHHVNSVRNDFANWIKYVFKKEFLAERINNAKTKDEMMKILSSELE